MDWSPSYIATPAELEAERIREQARAERERLEQDNSRDWQRRLLELEVPDRIDEAAVHRARRELLRPTSTEVLTLPPAKPAPYDREGGCRGQLLRLARQILSQRRRALVASLHCKLEIGKCKVQI